MAIRTTASFAIIILMVLLGSPEFGSLSDVSRDLVALVFKYIDEFFGDCFLLVV